MNGYRIEAADKCGSDTTIGDLWGKLASNEKPTGEGLHGPEGFPRLESVAAVEFSSEPDLRALDNLRGLLSTSQNVGTDWVHNLTLGEAAELLEIAVGQSPSGRLIDQAPATCARCGGQLSDEDRAWRRGWCESCRTSAIDLPDQTTPSRIVPAIGLDDPEHPTFVDFSTAIKYYPILKCSNEESSMPFIRHPNWADRYFFILCILNSLDGRWFIQGEPARSRQEWQTRIRLGKNLTIFVQVMPELAASLLMKAELDLPPGLAARVQTIASGGSLPQFPGPRTQAASGEAPLSTEWVGSNPDEHPRDDTSIELPDLVTLDQAASLVHKTKRALEYYKTKGSLPAPYTEGSGGKAALYDWRTLRPWLTDQFGMPLPEKFPRLKKS
jgi:hypothetical protein